MSQQG